MSKRLSEAKTAVSTLGKFSRESVFFSFTALSAAGVGLLLIAIIVVMVIDSRLSMGVFGLRFLYSSLWNPVTGEFGALASAFGTVVSTVIAMAIAVPLSLVVALFLAELASPKVSAFFSAAIELLAAIPSIIYGMWGLFVFAPLMAEHVQPLLGEHLGFLPLFQGPPMGIGVLTAGIILSLMILPFISSISRDVIRMVPAVVKEAAFGTGATLWEVTRGVTVPHAVHGIMGACFLGLGRALGETMAVTFVIGNSHRISASLFAPGNSIASTLANEFTEASDPLHLSALIELGLVLLLMSTAIQIAAQWWLKRISSERRRS